MPKMGRVPDLCSFIMAEQMKDIKILRKSWHGYSKREFICIMFPYGFNGFSDYF